MPTMHLNSVDAKFLQRIRIQAAKEDITSKALILKAVEQYLEKRDKAD